MKRRDFLRSAGAAATLPVLPLPAISASAAVAPVSAAKVNWAALYARANARASPELIQTWLRVGPEQANAILSDLVRRNIVHAPIAGSAAAVEPMYRTTLFPGARPFGHTIRKVIDEVLNDTETPLDPSEPEMALNGDATAPDTPPKEPAHEKT